ncbi:MAG: hypothetical protein RBG13Loki_0655 [Promethearchaeota archaeon CR_4]|nr:MAG: hypothetical protein RBG13Loki_0655 [Candidatus Lokiarchaeota archaeon CR_4]
MPERTITYEKLKADIDSGRVRPDEIYRLTISLTYAQLLEFLELRESYKGKSMSDMVRDGIAALRRQRAHDTNGIDLRATVEKLIQDQRSLQQQLQENVKKLSTIEGTEPTSEEREIFKGKILMFLGDIGPLASKDLAKYVGIDWKVIDKLCEELLSQQAIEWVGSKWRVKQ